MADEELGAVTSGNVSDTLSTTASDDDSDTEPVVTLVAGRQKRATAGNRYDRIRLLEEAPEDVAEEDDEVNLLFADDEDGEDEEFEGSADEEDVDALMDSSSDDDDQGPNAQEDDYGGEKEVEKEAKAERAKKRKADLILTTSAGLRKKVKIDPTIPQRPSTSLKPTKKKERISWLPSESLAASRSSLRKQTVAHREITHARLKEEEKRRAKFKVQQEKRERERRNDEPREVTQAERLAEAEKVERRNAKSLNRWEAMEKKRAEEQAAKLAALKNRKLEGPVVTWWSGVAKWTGPKLSKVGAKDTTQDVSVEVEVKKRGRKPKAYHEQLAAAREREADQSSTGTPQDQTTTPAPSENAINPSDEVSGTSTPMDVAAPAIVFATPRGPDNFFLEGIHEYASMQTETPLTPADPEVVANLSVLTSAVLVEETPPLTSPHDPPVIEEKSTRNVVILENFEGLSSQQRSYYGLFYNNRKSAKPAKQSHELCPITALPARYRDSSTGIGFANSFAYKKLQGLKNHKFTWSSMLGCYVGRDGVVARGVPEGFLGT